LRHGRRNAPLLVACALHGLEQGDLVAAIATGACRKQIGGALKNALALFLAAGCNGVIEFVDQRSAFWSAGRRRCLWAFLRLGNIAARFVTKTATSDIMALPQRGIIARVKSVAAKCKDSRNPLSIKPDKIAGRAASLA
jgi:hypothetical protein